MLEIFERYYVNYITTYGDIILQICAYLPRLAYSCLPTTFTHILKITCYSGCFKVHFSFTKKLKSRNEFDSPR